MKKIAIFSGYYLPHLGGVERYTFNLAKKMKELGNKVIIVTFRFDSSLKEIEETDYAKIYRLPMFKLFSNRYPIVKKNKRFKELFRLIDQEKIDSIILQTRFWTSSYVGAKFAKHNNIPVCLIEHGSTHFTVNNFVLDFFGRKYEHLLTSMLKNNVKDFYGVSNKCVEWLSHFKIDAKGVFYNSIDSDEFEIYKDKISKNNDYITITYVGRLIKEKGVQELIDAFKEISEKYKITLNIAGEGPLFNQLCEENDNIDNIHMLGKISHDEVMNLLAKSDIFINPSRFPEGLPTSILEAGLMKCAVIATPMGGTTEIISNDDYGLICGFDKNDIKSKIIELLENKEKREKISENLNKLVMHSFSWDSTVKYILTQIKMK